MKVQVSGRRADAQAAWRLLGDTDFMNRAAGNGELRSVDVAVHEGQPTTVGTMDGPLGMRIPFRDVDMSWVAGRYVRQVRLYDHVGLRATRLKSTLERDGDGVIPHVELEIEPGTALLRPLVSLQTSQIARSWQALLDKLPAPGEPAQPLLPPRDLPSAGRSALTAWADRAPEPLVARFEGLLRTGRPMELQQIRAFQLADEWRLDREEVLKAALDGVQVGALELYWSVRCTRCLGQTASASSLSDLADHATCPVCGIGFGTDLGRNVEVLFAPHPAVAQRLTGRFCTMFPALSPDQRALLQLAPGERMDEAVALEPGGWRLGPLGPEPEVPVRAETDGADTLRWSASRPEAEARVRAGDVRLELVNDRDVPVRVQIVAEQPTDRVPAALLTTLGSFRRQMGHQVLAPGLRISVRSVTLLFTDLTGSTEMYEEIGDAEAFALVRDHFDLLRGVVEAHGGAVVKTIGDAVMASFHAPERGVAAALAMQDAFEQWRTTRSLAHPPRLRVGLHAGPSLAVHTDASGLDYFGRTVNLAARAQGVAGGAEIAWTEAVHDDPTVRALLRDRGLAPEPLTASLKGLQGTTRLFRVRVSPLDPVAT